MKTLLILPLAISSLAFANTYTLSFTGSTLTNKTLGVEKITGAGEKTTHQGKMFEISLAEDKGQKFFGLNSRNAIHIGDLKGQWCVQNMENGINVCSNKINALAFGLDKQLYHNFNRLQLLGFFGLGYKLTGQTTYSTNYDYALPSLFYFRLGMEANYLITRKISVGLQYKHFSNGGLTTGNYGYDFYGAKINLMI